MVMIDSLSAYFPAAVSFLGCILMLGSAVLFSSERSSINYNHIASLWLIQVVLTLLLLKTFLGAIALNALVYLTESLQAAAHDGIEFVFGALGTVREPWGFIFAFHVLPIIIFFSALISLLSYVGIIDYIVYSVSFIVRPLLGSSRAETAVVIAKSFLGPAEAQLLIRDYFPRLTESELFVVMVSGLSMISASLFALYSALGIPARHLIAANIIGIPGALIFAKIIVPESQKISQKEMPLEMPVVRKVQNGVEAIIQGTLDGVQLVVAIAALSISFLAIISLFNMMLNGLGTLCRLPGITCQRIMGYILAPCGLLMGVSYQEALRIAELIGIKLILNEMIAFSEVAAQGLSERGLILTTYALCGFSNVSCMGMIVGSLVTLVPQRTSQVSLLAWKALLAATLSNLFSAYIVGIML